jgi:cytochrome P450
VASAETSETRADVYYDPYDFEIDSDPYPVWKRMRDERPLYHNERYDFWALTRFDDVERCLVDWRAYATRRPPRCRRGAWPGTSLPVFTS